MFVAVLQCRGIQYDFSGQFIGFGIDHSCHDPIGFGASAFTQRNDFAFQLLGVIDKERALDHLHLLGSK